MKQIPNNNFISINTFSQFILWCIQNLKKKFFKNFLRDFDRRRDDGENISRAIINATEYAQSFLSETEREILVQAIRKQV